MKQKIVMRKDCLLPSPANIPIFYINRGLFSVRNLIQYLSSEAESLKINELTTQLIEVNPNTLIQAFWDANTTVKN